MKPAFFFDRDGVVNRSPGEGYVLRREDFHFSEGIFDAIKFVKSRGYSTVIVTSQQGVGKGLMTQAALDEIHGSMQAELAKQGLAFDAIYACTCLESDPNCTCRKPAAEMILRAAEEHSINLKKSWLIGDHDRDILMAMNAGVPNSIRIRSEKAQTVAATHVLSSTTELLMLLERVI